MTLQELKERLAASHARVVNFEPSYYCRDNRYDNLTWAKRAKWYGGASSLWKR